VLTVDNDKRRRCFRPLDSDHTYAKVNGSRYFLRETTRLAALLHQYGIGTKTGEKSAIGLALAVKTQFVGSGAETAGDDERTLTIEYPVIETHATGFQHSQTTYRLHARGGNHTTATR
jgi:hypothetical protein